MLRIAHIIKLMNAAPGSEWAIAQPVTTASMLAAREAARDMHIDLHVVSSVDDPAPVPAGFTALRPLDRDVTAVGAFSWRRHLPLLRDVLDRLYEESDAEYFIYTNVDIALMPNFYGTVKQLIDEGHDAIVINRRTIPAEPHRVEDLPVMYATEGKAHPGFDCFVFRRDAYPHFVLKNVCLGVGHVDLPFICSMIACCSSFVLLKNEHLTFHLGDSRSWMRRSMREYRAHNDREASIALEELALRAPRRMRWIHRTLLRVHLLKNSFFVAEFLRLFSHS